MDSDDDRLLPPKAVARHLNCSESKLAKDRMAGTGPAFVKVGRLVKYTPLALREYEAARTRRSTSEPEGSEPQNPHGRRLVR